MGQYSSAIQSDVVADSYNGYGNHKAPPNQTQPTSGQGGKGQGMNYGSHQSDVADTYNGYGNH
jgi:hypothetical protein